jgi:outer membrane protein OmpA-like peptidoglycan-associated protein
VTQKVIYVSPSQPIIISLNHFALGSSLVSQVDKTSIKKLAQVIVRQGFTSLEVRGYTDNLGADTINVPLANNRAKATYQYLKQSYGKLPISVSLAGNSSLNPVRSNATDSGRAMNRRAEIYLR